jgi:hypothetical protein
MAISGETAFTMGMVGMILIAGSFVMETTGNTSVPFGNIAESLLIIGASLMFIAVDVVLSYGKNICSGGS